MCQLAVAAAVALVLLRTFWHPAPPGKLQSISAEVVKLRLVPIAMLWVAIKVVCCMLYIAWRRFPHHLKTGIPLPQLG